MACRDFHVPFGEDKAIVDAFQKDGYVVVSEVLNETEVSDFLEELWTSPNLLNNIDRNDKTSWVKGWPQQDGGRGFLQSADPFQDAVPWLLAQHAKIVHVQELLLGQSAIVPRVGRWGVMRPSLHRPEWRTDASWLHWDQNPWSEPGFQNLQSFVCLTDQTASSGGLLCVPGFQERWQSWASEHPEGSVFTPEGKVVTRAFGDQNPFPVPTDDPCQHHAVRVLAPRGALVLWDGRLPHQNFPNTDAEALRVVHYLHYKPATPELFKARGLAIRRKKFVMQTLEKEGRIFPHKLSALGRRVVCLSNENEDSTQDDAGSVECDEAKLPALRQAIQLCADAAKVEEEGDATAAAALLQRAAKCHPEIDEWYEAIFV